MRMSWSTTSKAALRSSIIHSCRYFIISHSIKLSIRHLKHGCTSVMLASEAMVGRMQELVRFKVRNHLANRACHKGKISLNFFGTCIFSWVYIYINRKFWFRRIFFISRWVKMPPKGYNEKNIKSLISWSLCIFE